MLPALNLAGMTLHGLRTLRVLVLKGQELMCMRAPGEGTTRTSCRFSIILMSPSRTGTKLNTASSTNPCLASATAFS